MKRLFLSALALTLGVFVFWSCDNEDDIDNGKGKRAERGTFMTVQQQTDAFYENLNGIVESIDFTGPGMAANQLVNIFNRKYSAVQIIHMLSMDSVLVNDTAFVRKATPLTGIITSLAMGAEVDSLMLDVSSLYMSMDLELTDTLYYDTLSLFFFDIVDTVTTEVKIKNVNHDCECLQLNVFADGQETTIRLKSKPGKTMLSYQGKDKRSATRYFLPDWADVSVSLKEDTLVSVNATVNSDMKIFYDANSVDSFKYEGNSAYVKANARFSAFDVTATANVDRARGLNIGVNGQYSGADLFSCTAKIDANMEGIDMTDSAQVLAWVQDYEKLKSISLDASLRGGKIMFKLNASNPFGDEELARILRSQMMPGAKLTEEQEAKLVERVNYVVDGGFYFEGFKEPQAKLKFVYREIADEAKPITDNEKINSVVGPDAIDFISEMFFKGGAYTMLTVHDDEGYEKDIQLEEYFAGINVDALTQALTQKVLEAFGPLMAQFADEK